MWRRTPQRRQPKPIRALERSSWSQDSQSVRSLVRELIKVSDWIWSLSIKDESVRRSSGSFRELLIYEVVILETSALKNILNYCFSFFYGFDFSLISLYCHVFWFAVFFTGQFLAPVPIVFSWLLSSPMCRNLTKISNGYKKRKNDAETACVKCRPAALLTSQI